MGYPENVPRPRRRSLPSLLPASGTGKGRPLTRRDALLVYLKGITMGAADVVPGVSGGTMAYIMGIYERLLSAIRSFDGLWLSALVRLDLQTAVSRPDLRFLAPLILGIGTAVLFFTRVVPLPKLLHTHRETIYGLFFGLITASILVLFREIGRLRPSDLPHLALGTAFGFAVVNLIPVETPETWWFLFLSGALAICAMILPGISGSFTLLILKKYDTVLGAVSELRLAVLLPFAAGCAAGLAVFTRFLQWLLRAFRRRTVVGINGILIGTLWVIWPFQRVEMTVVAGSEEKVLKTAPLLPDGFTPEVFAALAMGFAGFLAVLAIESLASKKKKKENRG